MLTDYCGAGSRLDPDRGLALSADVWAWQPKHDGEYARVSTDRRGRVCNVLSRAGRPIACDLLGILAGPPDSVFHGELELHTEAGTRIAAARGWPALHVFDVTRLGGRDCSWLAYGERYVLLAGERARLESAGVSNPWCDDDQGDAHDLKTGRYCARVPRDIRRLPLVDLYRDGRSLWQQWVERGGGEGLVAVRLDAPARARGAKRKIKSTDTLDCRVVACGGGAARLEYGGQLFAVSARGRWSSLVAGDIVEVACDGWYERGCTPRFARIVRLRRDLTI